MSGRDNKFPVSSGAVGRLMNKIKRSVSETVSSIYIVCVSTFLIYNDDVLMTLNSPGDISTN